ncbi:MAG: hypothetical protein ACRD1Y_04285 [Terriglobales bacterium]
MRMGRARLSTPVLLGLGALVCCALAMAQVTARAVVEHSLAARGGADGFAAVHTLSMSGVLQFGTQSAPISVWLTTEPRRVRIELQLPQGKLIEAYNGKQAWQITPGSHNAVVLRGSAARRVLDQALCGVDLVAGPGATLSMLGHGQQGGHSYYKVGFGLPTGDMFVQYIDDGNWLAFHMTFPGGVEEISGYQRVGGVLMPMTIVSGGAGQAQTTLRYEHVAVNLPVPTARFEPPVATTGLGPRAPSLVKR